MLFSFAGGTGHFLPLVPFARAAVAAGHAVAFAGQRGMVATVEDTGFTAFDTGGPTLLDASVRAPLLELDMDREVAALRDAYAGSVARERAPNLRGLCADWRPDVVVADEVDFGALVAAESLGLPHATVITIGSGSFVWRDIVAEPLAILRAEHRLAPDADLAMLHRHLVLSPFPPSFRDPANPLPPTGHAIRPTFADRPAAEVDVDVLAAPRSRPLVSFTLGTIFNLESGDLFERVLAGLSALDVEIVVTVGRELRPEALGVQPPNVHVRQYVPQSALLPHCDLSVSHGGSGSVVGALAHGVPMLLLPMGADQPLNAARCSALGVARVLDAFTATPEEVGHAAADLLGDGRYRRNAERIAAEIAGLPGPEHGVRLLEEIARARPRTNPRPAS
jgi:UDP:flavonoid glycosyltransferase YjiC (YdhE family)